MSDPTSSQIGVSLAIEAHRLKLLSDVTLQSVMNYYSGTVQPDPPEVVLRRIGRLNDEQLRRVFEIGHALTTSPKEGVRAGRPVSSRLTLYESLGTGAMGAVYRGYDRLLSRDVAVKVMKVGDVEDKGRHLLRLQRFDREARVMARVRHPAIVQIFDVGVSAANEPYLVMELVSGQSLADLIKTKGAMEPTSVVQMGRALAHALDACHAAGVIHRDVKPANILIDSQGNPRLTDFGVAADEDHARTRLTADHSALGTLVYMAPEQLAGHPASAKTDIYALGVTLHEALTGSSLFSGQHPAAVVQQILEAVPLRPSELSKGCSAELDAVVLKCLSKSPSSRYATAGHLAVDLEHVLAGTATAAMKGAARERRRRTDLVTARRLGALVTLFIVTAIVLTGRPGERPAIDSLGDLSNAASGSQSAIPSATTPTPTSQPSAPTRSQLVVRGNDIVNEIDGSVLVWVAPGQYLIGSDHGDPEERPLRAHDLSQGFHVGKFEVSVGQFRQFCASTGRSYPGPSRRLQWSWSHALSQHCEQLPVTDEMPAFDVPWQEADAYCRWAGLRLLTEVEWECAARGSDGRRYPWGNQVPTGRWPLANLNDNSFLASLPESLRSQFATLTTPGYDDGSPFLWPVGAGSAGASPCGALNMAVNVAEWCADEGPTGAGSRSLRGGDWAVGLWDARTSARSSRGASEGRGFRVCRDP